MVGHVATDHPLAPMDCKERCHNSTQKGVYKGNQSKNMEAHQDPPKEESLFSLALLSILSWWFSHGGSLTVVHNGLTLRWFMMFQGNQFVWYYNGF